MKYLAYAKRQGTRIVVVNPMREPGLERYWVSEHSQERGLRHQADGRFLQVGVGGDIAFLTGVLKHLIERDAGTTRFVSARHHRIRRVRRT